MVSTAESAHPAQLAHVSREAARMEAWARLLADRLERRGYTSSNALAVVTWHARRALYALRVELDAEQNPHRNLHD